MASLCKKKIGKIMEKQNSWACPCIGGPATFTPSAKQRPSLPDRGVAMIYSFQQKEVD